MEMKLRKRFIYKSQKRIKYLGINLTKEGQSLYNSILLKYIKEYLNK